MEYILSAQQMKECDDAVIGKNFDKSISYILRAAKACVSQIFNEELDCTKVLIFCGNGNNGADGFAIAKELEKRGLRPVSIIPSGLDKLSDESRYFIRQLEYTEIYSYEMFSNNYASGKYSLIIDALFGIGLSRPVEGIYSDIINYINKSETIVFSVDIPSGLSMAFKPETELIVKAYMTVTFSCKKLEMLLYPGRDLCGRLICADIGIYPIENRNYCITYNQNDIKLPRRPNDSNKGSFGKLLIYAGSSDIFGAAYLTAMSAYKCGCGMVHILTEKANISSLQILIPEAILHAFDENNIIEAENTLRKLIKKCDFILAGPGIGMGDAALSLLRIIIDSHLPAVFDADALNLISKNDDLLNRKYHACIFTPHMMEMSRLCKISVFDIKINPIFYTEQFAYEHNIILVLKDSVSFVSCINEHTYINQTGNNAMAKAGSGDVLAGIIAGLAAGHNSLYDSAVTGVYIHGLIGDNKRKEKGEYGVIARNLIEGIDDLEWAQKELM